MRVRLVLAALLLTGALAGCSSKTASVTFVCPDNTAIDLNTVPGHDAPGFDPVKACPVKPYAVLPGPITVSAYRTAPIHWEFRNGTFGTKADPAHAMLTEIRVSNTSVPQASLAGPESYGYELASLRREHQNLPAAFDAKLPFFTTPGTRYLRAYMDVFPNGATSGNETNAWSTEVTLIVTPVAPTGTTLILDRPLGPYVPGQTGNLTKETAAKLGDALVLRDSDAAPHTFTVTKSPPGSSLKEGTTYALQSMESAAAIQLNVPGTYAFSLDEPGTSPAGGVGQLAQTAEVNVPYPA